MKEIIAAVTQGMSIERERGVLGIETGKAPEHRIYINLKELSVPWEGEFKK